MSEKSVFHKAWSPEMTSQSFPVSCFWSRGFVPHRKWNLMLWAHQNTRKENALNVLISTLEGGERFNWANEKKIVIYTLIICIYPVLFVICNLLYLYWILLCSFCGTSNLFSKKGTLKTSVTVTIIWQSYVRWWTASYILH